MENNLPDNLVVVEQTQVGDLPVKSQFGAINAPNPKWADWMFRIGFLLTTVLTGYLAATNLLTVEVKYEWTVLLKVVVDPLLWGLSKMWGVKVDNEEVLKRIEDNKK